jgi:PAS domain S-box-containing protein
MSPVDIEATQLPGAAPGYSREDLVTLNVDDILQREKTFTAQRMVKELTEKKHITYERTCTTQDGKEIPVEMTSRLINVQGQPVVITTGEDITARKTAEQALHTSDRRLHDFFDHSPIGIALYDAKAALVDVNQAYLKMFGLTDRQGFARYGLFDLPYVAEQNRKALSKGDTVQYETIVDFEGLRRTPYFSTTRTGQVHYEIIINNLGLDEAFNPKGYLFQVQDITKRRAAETALLQSERQLRQAQKMEALGTMAGGIAHDFNNVLTPILGYAEIAMRLCPETDPRLQYLTEIFNASLRAKDLVTQILTFSRQTEQERKPVKITPILKEVLKLMRATLPATIEIRSMLKAERDLVMGDPTQIHQVLILKSA